MKIRPLHDRILVKRIEEEEKTKGGIIIPDTAKEKPMEGKVVAVGNGRIDSDGKNVAMTVKKGDRVAQLVLERCETPPIEEIGLLQETLRGEGGFGSTGN